MDTNEVKDTDFKNERHINLYNKETVIVDNFSKTIQYKLSFGNIHIFEIMILLISLNLKDLSSKLLRKRFMHTKFTSLLGKLGLSFTLILINILVAKTKLDTEDRSVLDVLADEERLGYYEILIVANSVIYFLVFLSLAVYSLKNKGLFNYTLAYLLMYVTSYVVGFFNITIIIFMHITVTLILGVREDGLVIFILIINILMVTRSFLNLTIELGEIARYVDFEIEETNIVMISK